MATSSNRPEITEKLIRRLTSGESFQRGREYFQSGAVTNLTRRGGHLLAGVEGSSYEPYRVDITFDAGGIASAECTCPYDWGGACKHIVAVLLAYINQTEQVEERPPLDTLLAELSSDQLRGILTSLAEQQPGLTDVIEVQVTALQTRAQAEQSRAQDGDTFTSARGKSSQQSQQQPRQRQTALDPATFRWQVHSILHSLDRMRQSEAYGHVGSIVQSVRQVAEQAMPFIEAGDGRSALAILQGVTEAYITDWTNLDDSDGELGAYFEDLGELWTEAILTADLTAAERKTWAKRLRKWQDEVSEYGIDEAFQPAETAAEQGWDYPPLLRILLGEAAEREVEEDTAYKEGYGEDEDEDYDEDEDHDEDEEDYWEEDDDESDYAGTLTLARLNVLERQGRTQEYLNLARAEGLAERYVTMLAKLDRIEEATEYALTRLRTAHDMLAVAQALRGKGAIEQALDVARHGLSMERASHPADRAGLVSLARWLRDLAESVGRRELALESALVAVRELPTLDNYQDVQSLAGERWPSIREELLKMLHEKSYHTRSQIGIYLYEGLIDDAIAAVSDTYVSHELVDMVVGGALKSNSRHEWVIEASRRQAEAIIEGGKSQLYGAAARWLEKALMASVAAGREDEWRAYVQETLARHKRKYSLVPLLEALLKRR